MSEYVYFNKIEKKFSKIFYFYSIKWYTTNNDYSIIHKIVRIIIDSVELWQAILCKNNSVYLKNGIINKCNEYIACLNSSIKK